MDNTNGGIPLPFQYNPLGFLNGQGKGDGTTSDMYNAIIGVKDAQAPISSTLSTINDGVAKNTDVVNGLNSISSSVSALANQPPPVVNVAPPNVNVSVSVDKSGNVTKETSFIPSDNLSAFDTALGREKLRFSK